MARYKTKLKPKINPRRSFLPLWLSLAGLALLLIAGWAFARGNPKGNANIEVTGAPRLKVETDVIDHGQVKLGSQIRDDIRVTNVGDRPLRFTEAPYVEVREGC